MDNSRERGSNLVEMAFAMFILVALIIAVADFGIAFSNFIRITNASREGARVATRIPQTAVADGIIRSAVISEARNSGLDLSDEQTSRITIEPVWTARVALQPIVVTVEYTMTSIIGGAFGVSEIPMKSKTEMMILRLTE
jgi:Flp pilus assembly protein TadG